MFVLKKAWTDVDPDIDMVQIHYTWTPVGEKPGWDRLEETQTLEVVSHTAPRSRACGIEIPRQVEGSERYDLHHFFVYVQAGRERVSAFYTETITSRDMTYEDWQGEHTLVGLRWAVGDWTFTNYTLLSLDGLDLEVPRYQNPYTPGVVTSMGLSFPYIYEFVKSQPHPHVFRGKVHGPRESLIFYDWHLLTLGGPAEAQDSETWDTNDGQHWQVVIV